jgi:hypothetical protein
MSCRTFPSWCTKTLRTRQNSSQNTATLSCLSRNAVWHGRGEDHGQCLVDNRLLRLLQSGSNYGLQYALKHFHCAIWVLSERNIIYQFAWERIMRIRFSVPFPCYISLGHLYLTVSIRVRTTSPSPILGRWNIEFRNKTSGLTMRPVSIMDSNKRCIS